MPKILSRDNPRVRRWQRLSREARFRREEGRAMIEGPHLIDAWIRHRGRPVCVLATEAATGAGAWPDAIVVSDAVMRAITDVGTPQGVVAEVAIPQEAESLAAVPACLFLDAVQDAGNVGAILRSACAFGVLDVVIGAGCADPWSPKVLRAAAGAHALLCIREYANLGEAMDAFGGMVYWTAPRGGMPLDAIDQLARVGWIFGSEGQGVRAALASRCAGAITIPMPGGSESLNVAAAAAICLYERSRARR